MKKLLYTFIFLLCLTTTLSFSGCANYANSVTDTDFTETFNTIKPDVTSEPVVIPVTIVETTAETTKEFDVEDPSNFKIDYDTLSDHEKIIYNHLDIKNSGDHSKYADYYVPSFREGYNNFFTDPSMQKANLGVLNVKYTKLIYIEKKGPEWTPMLRETMKYSKDQLETYFVGYDVRVFDETSKYYNNGVRYELITLASDDGVWGVATEVRAPVELIAPLEGKYPTFHALNEQWQLSFGKPYEVGMAKELLG